MKKLKKAKMHWASISIGVVASTSLVNNASANEVINDNLKPSSTIAIPTLISKNIDLLHNNNVLSNSGDFIETKETIEEKTQSSSDKINSHSNTPKKDDDRVVSTSTNETVLKPELKTNKDIVETKATSKILKENQNNSIKKEGPSSSAVESSSAPSLSSANTELLHDNKDNKTITPPGNSGETKETIEEKTQSSSDEINSHSNTQKKTMIIL